MVSDVVVIYFLILKLEMANQTGTENVKKSKSIENSRKRINTLNLLRSSQVQKSLKYTFLYSANPV